MDRKPKFTIIMDDYPSDSLKTKQISCMANSDDDQSKSLKNKSINLVLDPSTPEHKQLIIRDLLKEYLIKITTSDLR